MVGFTKLPRLVFGCLGRSPTCHAAKLGAGQSSLTSPFTQAPGLEQ